MNYSELSKKIKLLLLDVDGVLTNGEIIIGQEGELCKAFNAMDGMGISLAQRCGIQVGIITGRESSIVQQRARELGINILHMGVKNKFMILQEILAQGNYDAEEIAFMGDDLNDLLIMKNVGLAIAPANAAVEVRERAHYICRRSGGQGAVREVAEYILKNQGLWLQIINEYLKQVQGEDNVAISFDKINQ